MILLGKDDPRLEMRVREGEWMAYMRVPDYIYVTGDDERGPDRLMINMDSIPFETAQELAVMLVAEMSDEERETIEARACAKWGGNIGCESLNVKRGMPDFNARVLALVRAGVERSREERHD